MQVSKYRMSLRALSICPNWPAGPWPDQSVWKWNSPFPRVFAEKTFSFVHTISDLTDLAGKFWLKVRLSLRREWSVRSVLTNGKRPRFSPIFQTTFICCGNCLPPLSRENTYCLYREDSDKDARKSLIEWSSNFKNLISRLTYVLSYC